VDDLSALSHLTILVMMEKTAAIAELKTHLSRYLSRVKAGEEILVTERGVPVARLVPVRAADQALEDLRDLERAGLIRRGTGRLPKDFWTRPRPRDPRALIRGAALREREGGW
jgi:prevent-host-death family protein